MSVTALNKTTVVYWPTTMGLNGRRDVNFQTGWRQSPVTDVPLSYSGTQAWDDGSKFPLNADGTSYVSYQSDVPNRLAYTICLQAITSASLARKQAVAKAYGELRDGLFDAEAQLGATLAEYRSSLDMVSERAGQLFRAFRALKKGHFRTFLDELKIRPKRRHRRTRWTRPRDASAIWLEYWFGWAPLLSDIYQAVQVLHRPVPDAVLSGSGSGSYTYSQTITSEWNPTKITDTTSGRVYVKMGAKVRVINPNLATAARLGLTNPVSVVWELVPFSFLVDWFIGVGDYIGSYSDFDGLEVYDSYTTTFCRASGYTYGKQYYSTWPGYVINERTQVRATRRSLGLEKPIPFFKVPTRLSVTRAATAMALLVGIFTKG